MPIGGEADRASLAAMWSRTATIRSSRISTYSTRFLALSVRTGGLAKISIRPSVRSGRARCGAEFFIASDEAAYAMALSVNPELDTDLVRYAYSSLTTPTTVYDYNVRTGEKTC